MADIGLIGLAVMGENLVLNLESKGFQVFENYFHTSILSGAEKSPPASCLPGSGKAAAIPLLIKYNKKGAQ